MTKTENMKRIRFAVILLLLVVFAANAAFSEPVERTESVVSDSVAPMKLEIDSKTNDTAETKTVILTNTGTTATEYICYIEQTGGKKESNADFELSESKITLLPGDSKKLEIEIPVRALKTNSADAEYKLKIIRNPNTQTPVGYIIPITLTETESGNKTNDGKSVIGKSGGNKGPAIVLSAADPKTETEKEPKVGNKNQNKTAGENGDDQSGGADTDEKTNEKKDENNFMKKIGVVLLLVFFMTLVSVAGIILSKKKK